MPPVWSFHWRGRQESDHCWDPHTHQVELCDWTLRGMGVMSSNAWNARKQPAGCLIHPGSTYTQVQLTQKSLIGLNDWISKFQRRLHVTPCNPPTSYRDHNEEIMRNLQLQTVGGGISICGDGHSDSPGFSAKYTTYSFMSDETKQIIMVDLVQVNIQKCT